MLQLRDTRTGAVAPVVGPGARVLRVQAGDTGLRTRLVADVVSRVAALVHDLQVVVSVAAGHDDSPAPDIDPAALNIHPADTTEPLTDADVTVGGAGGDPAQTGRRAIVGRHVQVGALSLRPDATTALRVSAAGSDPLALRLAMLDTRYEASLALGLPAIKEATTTLFRWRAALAEWARSPGAPMASSTAHAVTAAFDDNLDIPLALQALLGLEADDSITPGAKFETFAYADRLLGLDLACDIR